jgi:hypothetical protein
LAADPKAFVAPPSALAVFGLPICGICTPSTFFLEPLRAIATPPARPASAAPPAIIGVFAFDAIDVTASRTPPWFLARPFVWVRLALPFACARVDFVRAEALVLRPVAFVRPDAFARPFELVVRRLRELLDPLRDEPPALLRRVFVWGMLPSSSESVLARQDYPG